MRKPKTDEQKAKDLALRNLKDNALREAGLVQRKVWATPEQHAIETQARSTTESMKLYAKAMNSVREEREVSK
jgi:hypothetical protein